VNRLYGLELDETQYTTIGGLLFGTLGHLPKAGDRITVKDTVFEILEMDGRRVSKIRVVPHHKDG
jgi:CBS domain containing-hemolysin-like protein